MSKIEIILIVMACSVPLVALLFSLPKKIKGKKEEKKVVEAKPEIKEVKEEVKKEEKPIEKTVRPIETSFSADDFKGYLQERQNNSSKPKRVELPRDFVDRTEDYFPRRRRVRQEKPKTVAEEIKSLSPELKALIISGVLDKKDFDNN